MNITDVSVRLVSDKNERLKAFCTMTLDGEFVVRDIKIIEGAKGLFVAMPSRKITDHCPKCGGKNPLKAKFCNDCGAELAGGKFAKAAAMTDKLHADVAHPINSECRSRIQQAVITAFEEEVRKSKLPGYKPPKNVSTDDYFDHHEDDGGAGKPSGGSGGGSESADSDDSRPGRSDFSAGIF